MNFKEPYGVNFRLAHEVPLGTLRDLLEAVFNFLKPRDASANLFRYDDFWEHDGLHFLKDKLTWEKFKASFREDSGIVESMPGDFNVKVGISPPTMNWYLRYYVDLDDDSKECFLDVTVPRDWENDFRKEIGKSISIDWVTEDAIDYYKAIRLE
jgi:hypothetical protein